MRYIRFEQNGQTSWGQISTDDIQVLSAAPYAGGRPTGLSLKQSDVKLLAPCEPGKIVAIGKNYFDHVQEFDSQVPETPILFIKPSTAVIGPEQSIFLPDPTVSNRVDYEGELALVISQKATKIKAGEAGQYILGYTCLNDVTARDVQHKDGQWTRAKGMDTFAPIGPWLTDEVEPGDLTITTRLNGEIKQQSSTKMLMWSIGELLAFITQSITLLPGDVVTTGTPAGVGPMLAGDVVTVEISGIGVLRNTVQACTVPQT